MVETAMLLLAASLNLSQGLSVFLVVARSGKTSDLRSSTWTSATPLWIGLFPLLVCGDRRLLEGALGKRSVGFWFCWAEPSRHNQQMINQAVIDNCSMVLRLSRIKDSPESHLNLRRVSCRCLPLYTRAVSPSLLAIPLVGLRASRTSGVACRRLRSEPMRGAIRLAGGETSLGFACIWRLAQHPRRKKTPSRADKSARISILF